MHIGPGRALAISRYAETSTQVRGCTSTLDINAATLQQDGVCSTDVRLAEELENGQTTTLAGITVP